MKIEFASDSILQKYFEEMMLVLSALESVEEDWGESLLTDESSVSDFMMRDYERKAFEKALGIKVKKDHKIVDLCKKLRKKAKKAKE